MSMFSPPTDVTYNQRAVLLDRPEIRLMLSLLKVINDPYNDTELAKVLMSPLYCFTADDMARLRTGTFGFTGAGNDSLTVDFGGLFSVDSINNRGSFGGGRLCFVVSFFNEIADNHQQNDDQDDIKKFFHQIFLRLSFIYV